MLFSPLFILFLSFLFRNPLAFLISFYITVKINYYNLSNTNTILYTIFVFINQFHFLFKKIFTSIRREFLLYLTLLATFATWSMLWSVRPVTGSCKAEASMVFTMMLSWAPSSPHALLSCQCASAIGCWASRSISDWLNFLLHSLPMCASCERLKLVFHLASSNRTYVVHESLR